MDAGEEDRFARLCLNARHLDMPEHTLDRLSDDIASGAKSDGLVCEELKELSDALAPKVAKDVNLHMQNHGEDGVIGCRVTVIGLKNARQHNGVSGFVRGYAAENARFEVHLEDSKVLHAKGSNLRLLDVLSSLQPETQAQSSDIDSDAEDINSMVHELFVSSCAACGVPRKTPGVDGTFSNLSACPRCQLCRYCSVDCQRDGWMHGHRESCCPQDGQYTVELGRTVLPPVTMPNIAMFEVYLGFAREFGCARPQIAKLAFLQIDDAIDQFFAGGPTEDLTLALRMQKLVIARLSECVLRVMRHHQQHTRNHLLLQAGRTFDKHDDAVAVQGAGCQLISSVVKAGMSEEENDECVRDVVAAGAIDVVTCALALFPAVPALMDASADVFSYCSAVDEGVYLITDQGRELGSCAQVVVRAMTTNAANLDVQIRGCEVLRGIAAADCARHTGRTVSSVSVNPGAGQPRKDRSWTIAASKTGAATPSSVVAASGVAAAVAAIRAFKTVPMLVAKACQVLLNVNNSGQAAIWAMIEAGALAQLVAVIETFHEDDHFIPEIGGWVTDKACSALTGALCDRPSCKQAVQAGLIPAIFACLRSRERHAQRNKTTTGGSNTPTPVQLVMLLSKCGDKLQHHPGEKVDLYRAIYDADPKLEACKYAAKLANTPSALARRPQDARGVNDWLTYVRRLMETQEHLDGMELVPQDSKHVQSVRKEQNLSPQAKVSNHEVLSHVMHDIAGEIAGDMPILGALIGARQGSSGGGGTSGSVVEPDTFTLNLIGVCALCGAPADKRCSKCKITHYCCAEHQRDSWKLHKKTCGNPLPTPCLVREAPVDVVCTVLEEFGGAHAGLAVACIQRCLELLSNERQLHLFCERSAALAAAAERSMRARPEATELQRLGTRLLTFIATAATL